MDMILDKFSIPYRKKLNEKLSLYTVMDSFWQFMIDPDLLPGQISRIIFIEIKADIIHKRRKTWSYFLANKKNCKNKLLFCEKKVSEWDFFVRVTCFDYSIHFCNSSYMILHEYVVTDFCWYQTSLILKCAIGAVENIIS